VGRHRLVRAAVIGALTLSIAVSGTAFAGYGGTSVLNVFGSMGVWGTNTNFFARWKAYQFHAEGTTTWQVEGLEMSALVQNGKACTSDICTDWSFAANARFYNSSGAQVAITTPPIGGCYTAAYGVNDRHFVRCNPYAVTVPITAKTMKFTWTVSVKRRDGIWVQAWTATKTVALVTT